MEYINALIEMQLVPSAWWPIVGQLMAYALGALMFVTGTLAVIDRIDMQDGMRDVKWVPAWRAALVLVLSIAQAILEMLPVQLPFIRGLERLREIKRASESDSGRLK